MSVARFLQKTRYRLGREIGTVRKPHDGRCRIALAFPNSYYVGMSNLGFQVVYNLLNRWDEVVCERVFLPDPQDAVALERSQMPLFTMESQTPVRDFDVVAFSLSYELDYPNALRILQLSGIKPWAHMRSTESNAPIVIAGGPAATFNPEPMSSFVDAFVIGEAEEVLPSLVEALLCTNLRVDFLDRIAQIPGIYVPMFYEPEYCSDGRIKRIMPLCGVCEIVSRQWLHTLNSYPAVSAILTPETEFSNMILTEVARGCGRQCRFCIAGFAYLPPRVRSSEVILDSIYQAEGLFSSSNNPPRIGLVGASLFDHPVTHVICQELLKNAYFFSIASTRVDTLDQPVAEMLFRGGQETLTIAPEAGTLRLRQVLNKDISDEDVLSAADIAWDAGFRKLKLYFMVGLPTEEPEDRAGIVALVSHLIRMHRWRRITVSLSCFVPKPWTPFQWVPMQKEKNLALMLRELKRALAKWSNVEVASESPRQAIVQSVLARGDRRLGAHILSVSQGTNWKSVLSPTDIEFYAYRARDYQEIFAWDHLRLGVGKDYLWAEYNRAMRGQTTFPCPSSSCVRCGVCRL